MRLAAYCAKRIWFEQTIQRGLRHRLKIVQAETMRLLEVAADLMSRDEVQGCVARRDANVALRVEFLQAKLQELITESRDREWAAYIAGRAIKLT